MPTMTPDAPAATPDDLVERALAVPTRAGIYQRLRRTGQPASAREVAEMFGVHANVARTHLDHLADAGLVVTSRRRSSPVGGRPAKVYVAREQDGGATEVKVPPGSQLAVSVVVQLIAGLGEHEAKLELLAEEQGARLVRAAGGRADKRDFEAAAHVAVESLRGAFPEARIERVHTGHAHVAGLEVGLRLIGEVDGAVGDALARGFLRGAVGAAGCPSTVQSEQGAVKLTPLDEGLGQFPAPVATIDVRGKTYQTGVMTSVRAMEGVRPGDFVEIFTDLQGAPAAFSRWADRAGHQIADVTRIRDDKGRQAVRLLLRHATG